MPNPDEWGQAPAPRLTQRPAQPTGNEDGDGAPSGEGGDSTAPMQGSMREKRERNQNKRARKRQAREMSTGSRATRVMAGSLPAARRMEEGRAEELRSVGQRDQRRIQTTKRVLHSRVGAARWTESCLGAAADSLGWLVWIFFMHPGCILTTAPLCLRLVRYSTVVALSGEQRGATTTDAHGIRRKRTERRNRTMNHRNTYHPSPDRRRDDRRGPRTVYLSDRS